MLLRMGHLELEEDRGAANNGVNMDRLSSAWGQLAGLALIFIWPSMLTLVVKGTNPLDGWVYLGQKGGNSVLMAGRRLDSYGMSGREKIESFPVVLLDDRSVVRADQPFRR